MCSKHIPMVHMLFRKRKYIFKLTAGSFSHEIELWLVILSTRLVIEVSRGPVKRERMNHQLFTLDNPEVSEVGFKISRALVLTFTNGKFTTLET